MAGRGLLRSSMAAVPRSCVGAVGTVAFCAIICLLSPGCATTQSGSVDGAVGAEGDNTAMLNASQQAGRTRAMAIADARLVQDEPSETRVPTTAPSQPTGPLLSTPTAEQLEAIYGQIPGIEDGLILAMHLYEKEVEAVEDARKGVTDERTLRQLDSRLKEAQVKHNEIRTRLGQVLRPKVVRLGLTEAIRRALEHNYALHVQGYNPAIDTSRIVEAEAQFDAVFFTDFTSNDQDRPSSSQLMGTQSVNRIFNAGVRKILASGMQVSTSYSLTRTKTNLVFQTLNPSYFNQFIVEFRQPFLRGFGLDFNRSQIELRRLDRAISMERLRREIRETLFNIEQSYWNLWQVRRRLAVNARLLADFKQILSDLEQREALGLDVYPVQVNLTRSRIEQREVVFIQIKNAIKNAEDTLKSLINDPDLNQAVDVEIIPTDMPSTEGVLIDQIGEVTAALTHRSELNEAKLTIEQAQLGIGVAKNQALPRLDLLFRYIVDGLGSNADDAFDQLTQNDFHEYVIALEFEYPIGNRGPEAVLRRARLQQAQAIAGHRAQIENVITEVKVAIRELQTNYEQIAPSYRAAKASEEQLRAIIQRQETRSPPNLEIELNAHEALAAAREQLLRNLANYHLGLVNLERRKGTLLDYNNIVIEGIESASHTQRYRAIGLGDSVGDGESGN